MTACFQILCHFKSAGQTLIGLIWLDCGLIIDQDVHSDVKQVSPDKSDFECKHVHI